MKSIGICTGEKRLSLTPNMEKMVKGHKGEIHFQKTNTIFHERLENNTLIRNQIYPV